MHLPRTLPTRRFKLQLPPFSPHHSTGERCALRLYSRHVHNCYSVGITLYTAARDMIPNSTICTFGGNRQGAHIGVVRVLE